MCGVDNHTVDSIKQVGKFPTSDKVVLNIKGASPTVGDATVTTSDRQEGGIGHED